MPEQWLTYRQLGEVWNTTPEAARARSRRGNYQRRVNEQGVAEVLVDVDGLAGRSPRMVQGEADWTALAAFGDEHGTSDEPDEMSQNSIQLLELQVAALSRDLSKAEEQVETMRKYLATEREQVSHLMTVLLRGEKRRGKSRGLFGFLLFWRRSKPTNKLHLVQPTTTPAPASLRSDPVIMTDTVLYSPRVAPDTAEDSRTNEQDR